MPNQFSSHHYRRRSVLALIGSVALGGGALAACAQGTPVSTGAGTSASAAAVASARQGATTVAASSVASSAGPSRQATHLTATNWSNVTVSALYDKLVQQFQQAHPSTTVSYAPTADYWTKVPAQAAAGTAPDVFWMNAQNLGAWADRQQLLNLTPLAATAKYDFSDFWKAGLDAYTINSDLLSLPSQVDNRGLFFNRTMFENASATPPPVSYADKQWDWQAFLAACQHVTKAAAGGQPAQYGCIVPTSFIDYAPWVWANGGSFLNDDRTASTMTSAETVGAFQFLQDLIQKYHVAPGPDALKTESATSMFSSGKIGMTTDTISLVTQYRANASHFTWDTGALPAGKAGFTNQSSGPAWSIEQQTKHADESWALCTFLVSPASERLLAQGGAELPSRLSIAKEVWGQSSDMPAHGSVFLDGMNYVRPNPFVWNWSDIQTLIDKQLTNLWNGSKTAQDVMQAIKPPMDQLLQQKPS